MESSFNKKGTIEPTESTSIVWERFGDKAVSGDSEALGRLLAHFHPLLLSKARLQVSRRLQSAIGASDIVQLTCEDAIDAVKRVRANNSRQFAKWLLRLLRNNLVDAHRKFVSSQKRSKLREVAAENSLTYFKCPSPSVADNLLRNEELELAVNCIRELKSPYRELLVWYMVDGKSTEEISLLVHRSQGAVRMLLARAKTALRREMLSRIER